MSFQRVCKLAEEIHVIVETFRPVIAGSASRLASGRVIKSVQLRRLGDDDLAILGF